MEIPLYVRRLSSIKIYPGKTVNFNVKLKHTVYHTEELCHLKNHLVRLFSEHDGEIKGPVFDEFCVYFPDFQNVMSVLEKIPLEFIFLIKKVEVVPTFLPLQVTHHFDMLMVIPEKSARSPEKDILSYNLPTGFKLYTLRHDLIDDKKTLLSFLFRYGNSLCWKGVHMPVAVYKRLSTELLARYGLNDMSMETT